ncbi:hypothetical protein GCM10010300_24870 [Streptomyces olivaceoviridis]|nr:hypothetical protein [Streptomyces olivaceoviridis]GGY79960.1 hypothetical protein GCM10010300_24870 [Streptomyces olivaceoviridis]
MSGHDAAVDVPDGAGDPVGLVRQEEGDGGGDVVGGAGAAQGVEGVEPDGLAVGGRGGCRLLGAGLRTAGDDGAAGAEDVVGDGVADAAGAADDDDLVTGEVVLPVR